MLVRRDGHGDFVKVLDFGLALVSRALAADLAEEAYAPTAPKITQVGEIFGTPEYMSPEQAVSAGTDIRTDLYAVGVVLYELLTGRRPFDGDTPLALIQQHLATPPPAMRQRAPGAHVPADVEALVQRLLEKQPAGRLQTPQELIAAIDQLAVTHQIAWPGLAPSSSSLSGLSSSQQLAATLPAGATTSQSPGRRPAGLRALLWDRKLPRPLPRLPLSITLLGLAALVGLAVALWPGSPPQSELPLPESKPISSAPPPPDRLAPQSAFDAANAGGVLPLETLASRYPADPRIRRALVLSHSSQRQYSEAMGELARLAQLDPNVGNDLELIRIIVAALSASPDAMQAAVNLLENELGELGVDLLYDLTSKPTPARWKPRLHQSLAKPAVLAKATLATRIALDLRSAKSCEAKRALLPRAQHEGGARALTQLRSLTQTDGCGLFSLGDCWSCLRKDSALSDALKALEAQAKVAPPSGH